MPKRKRVQKQTQTKTHREQDAANSKHGLVAAATPTPFPLPLVPSPHDHPRAIFILDNASLKKALVKKEWKILCSNDDANFLRKQNKNLNDYRPDIVFEALRSILDSTVKKRGLLGAVFVKTDQGVLFEVKPHVHIPRTSKRFCGLIMELLQKSVVRAEKTNEILLRVVEEPVARHLPVQSRIIGLSYGSQKLVDMEDYVSVLSDDMTPVFVVGAMVNGQVKRDLAHDYISVSNYPLDAKGCVGVICDALEQKWSLY